MIVLDTNVLIEILKDNQSAIQKVESFNCSLAISSITVMELFYGALNKAEVKKLDDEYMAIAKKLQGLRDAKKERQARALEPKLKGLRQKLSQKTAALQKFFEESQKHLYKLENKEMGSLSKSLDQKVDKTIEKVAKRYKLKAVFEKRFFYYGAKKAVKDITEEVLAALNKK